MTNNKLKEKYNNLTATEMYKEFMEFHPDYKLSHFFFVSEKMNMLDEQIGFYSEKVDKVVSFDLVKHSVSEPENAAKTSGTIPSFNLDNVNLDIDETLKMAEEIMKENYSSHNPTKYICILQVLEGILMWNITIVTNTLNMINIKMNAKHPKVITHNIQSIMSLSRK
jgi:hypothetical protein